MRNDRVLIPVLHVEHNTKCFSPCVYSFFHQLSDNCILSQKMPTFGLYEYTVEGLGCGYNQKRGLAETDSSFIKKFDMF